MELNERRPAFRKGLSSLYLPYYDALCGVLGPEWQPYMGLRSFPEQDQLFAKGRTQAPLGRGFVVTNARGGESAHNYGCGSDWTWFDADGVLHWLKKDDPLWEDYVTAIEKVGLRAGKEFGDIDHNELLLSCDWKHVLVEYNTGGMVLAQQHIENNMAK